MKPIKLKIKGLNSFIESQEVNFEKLTDKGLFGIFGPTGSGKSTILDGITLALYGDVARKSSNYMNTNCDTLNVSFEFQMSEKETKRYRVDREFKRDSKTGSVRSKSAKIMDITEGGIVLEEGTNTVTKKCEEIIGLKLEDFTRTVVLPQGKFSEFLKLEGKERRNMLERLFNLQKYGDNLSMKLVTNIKEEKQKSDILEGELKSYEHISPEILKEKTDILTETREQRDKCKIELDKAEEDFNKGKELWNLQNELKEHFNREKKIKEREVEINESQKKVTLGESAVKVKPYIDNYENTLGKINIVNHKLLDLKNKVENIRANKEKIEAILEIAKGKKEKELPILNLKEQKVIEAIDEKAALQVLIREKSLLEKNIVTIEENLKNINNNIEKNEKNIIEINNNIGIKENRIESLKVPEEYKQKVNEGIVILNNYNIQSKQKNTVTNHIKTMELNIEKLKVNSENLSKELTYKEELLLKSEEALKELIEACPGDQNTLLTLQQKLSIIKDKWNKYKEFSSDNCNSKELIQNLKKELDKKEEEKSLLEQELNEITNNIKKIEIENIAHTLREKLLEGESCPVCGSREHHNEYMEIIDPSNLEQLKITLNLKEKKKSQLSLDIAKAQTTIYSEEKNIEDKEFKIKELGGDFKANSVDMLQQDFKNLKDNIDKFNSEKIELEKQIKALNQEKNNLDIEYNKENTKLIENILQLEKLQQDLKEVDREFEKTEKQLLTLKAQLDIEDFISKRAELSQKEEEKGALEKDLKILRDKLNNEQLQKEELNKQLGTLREDLREKKTTVIEKNKNLEEKQKSIKNKVGDVEDLDSLKKEISDSIVSIEKEYKKAEIYKNEIEKQYNQCNNDIISTQSELSALNERSINDKEKLEKMLFEEGIKDIEEAKINFISNSEINKLKLEIEEHRNDLAKLFGAIENLKRKIDNKSLTAEQWIEVQNIKNKKTEMLSMLEENKIKLETEVESISKKLGEKQKLLKKKEALDYKLSLLDDLDKLFKGKKFIEFVAANQLKYVSIEACKKLKEITGGNYGLEVDENGKFLIRDYKNGGAQRDASTLSGGETFVTSLALALALSAQIQLKGTAPLELFFLDEGFGTLDDNLLEVVMDSLEKIHNDRLSIGIISHVESIKNRVPVKLMVTAAEAGMGGSKVKIERS